MAEILEPKTNELVGIAAAIAGHCQPCLAYHYKEAQRLGVAEGAIRAAVDLARAVRQAGDKHMDEFAERGMAGAEIEAP